MLDYRAEELRHRKLNTKSFREKLAENRLDKALIEKINSFCERHDLSFNLVKYKILHDDLFCLYFIKDPGRQGIHQAIAAEFIKSISCIESFRVLPASGKDSLYGINGMVVSEAQKKNSSEGVKSIDFEWAFPNAIGEKIKCYASHKYTHQDGGAQRQQFIEQMKFMEHAQRHKQNLFFYAICDGSYYRSPYEDSLDKIDYLNKNYGGPRCRAISLEKLEQHIKSNL
ncbi:hypothetical protein [Comamonas suwonensis]|uniref:hypothetical protein n=1 Tax=Comamonas suwonensis TaxID=2606214 RepID=UPI00145E0DD3|nr:hypothetical protein [Comamonas suwonensis]MBI1624940.1 hypothetical protein [Comamonas suwonensis]